MPSDPKLPGDTELSEADVKRVLERAVRIDGAQTVVSVSDLTQAAHEAGISERAMMQAVRELLEDRELVSTADSGNTTSVEARTKSAPRLRAAAFGFLLLIALVVMFFLLRIAP